MLFDIAVQLMTIFVPDVDTVAVESCAGTLAAIIEIAEDAGPFPYALIAVT